MDRIQLKQIARQRRIDPDKALPQLHEIEVAISRSDVDPKIKTLRTTGLKRERELWNACLFCYGMSVRIGKKVWVCPHEDSDIDFVAYWKDKQEHFAPIQLKEVVPHHLNAKTSLHSVIENNETKYNNPNLTLVIRLNQQGRLDPNEVALPRLNIAALWAFGAASDDGARWFVFGDMLEEPSFTFFDYPT